MRVSFSLLFRLPGLLCVCVVRVRGECAVRFKSFSEFHEEQTTDMYSVIQFSEKDGGTVSVIKNQWFTPRRCEVYWPPVKGTKAFERVLADAKTPDEKWKLYSVQRVFCQTDLQTEAETEPNLKRRRAKRYVSTSDEDNDNHIRPPPLKKKTFNKLQTLQAPGNVSLEAYYRDIPESNSHNTILHEESDDLPLLDNSILQELSDVAELSPGINDSISVTPVRSRFGAIQTPRPNLKSSVTESPSCAQTSGLCDVAELSPRLSNSISATTVRSRFGAIQTPWPNLKSGVTESCYAQTSGYQDKVVSLLAMIKSQNDQILGILKESKLKVALKPEFKLPLKTFEELEATETLLKIPENYDNLGTFIESIGGRNTSNNVSRAMKLVLADSLAKEFNFYGKRSQKKPFCELLIRNCIVGSIKNATRATVKEIEDNIKIWLKHAPERLKKASR